MEKTENKIKFAIFKTGGKQYKVSEGDVLSVEKLDIEEGKPVDFEEVLLICEGETVEIGHPVLDKAKIKASIVEQAKDDKVVVFKYKPKKNYRKKTGHRQRITKIKIESILKK